MLEAIGNNLKFTANMPVNHAFQPVGGGGQFFSFL